MEEYDISWETPKEILQGPIQFRESSNYLESLQYDDINDVAVQWNISNPTILDGFVVNGVDWYVIHYFSRNPCCCDSVSVHWLMGKIANRDYKQQLQRTSGFCDMVLERVIFTNRIALL